VPPDNPDEPKNLPDHEEELARGYEVVYREAIRALDLQRQAFDALRARVGFLLSAAAISTSFLGGLVLRSKPNFGTWIAIGLFILFGAVALRILWPRAEGAAGFTATPSLVIAQYLEDEDGEERPRPLWVMYHDLALYAEEAHDLNEEAHLKPLTNYFRAAILLLTAEIAAWVIDLALR
jgi:hypothetical protein